MTRRNLLAPLFLLMACETPFDPNIPDPKSLVVNAFISPGNNLAINITESAKVLDHVSSFGFTPYNDAIVTIKDDEGIHYLLEPQGGGDYLGMFQVFPESNYELNVSSDAFPTLIAIDKIPRAVELDYFEVEVQLTNVNLDDKGYKGLISFKDPDSETNYYAVEVYFSRKGQSPTSVQPGFLFTEDTDIDTSGNNDIQIGGDNSSSEAQTVLYFDDLSLKDENLKFEFYIATNGGFDPTTYDTHAVLKSISPDYYRYLETSDFQHQILESNNSLAEPVQVFSNISNGQGIFAAYNSDTVKAKVLP